MIDWAAPVTRMHPDWTDECVGGFQTLTWFMLPWLRDPLTQRHWDACLEILDQREPGTVDEANERWREFVGAVWGVYDQAWARWSRAQARRRLQ